jgi:signal transduction histidine kinase
MEMFRQIGRIARDGPATHLSGAINSSLTEKVIARTYAAAAFTFGALSVGPAFSGQRVMGQVWAWVFGLLLFGGLAGSATAGVIGRGVRPAAGVVAVAYLGMVVSWPIAVADPNVVQPGTPWIWGLCNLAMAAAAVAFSEAAAGAYVLVVSIAWGVIRMTPSGGQGGWEKALQDSGYVFVLGIAVAVVAALLRQAATQVDAAHAAATAKYTTATQDHENEKQRLAVDALLHDSVLSTLLQVTRADTAEAKRVAARMALKSLNVIADTEDDMHRHNRPITAAEIRERFEQLRSELDVDVAFVTAGPDEHVIPYAAAEALIAATLQALVNSAQHAGPTVTERSVTVRWSHTCVTVVVADDGQGFDPSIDTGRLGVRVSIIERVEAVGGHVQIDSAPGRGARFTMIWDHPSMTEGSSDAPTETVHAAANG